MMPFHRLSPTPLKLSLLLLTALTVAAVFAKADLARPVEQTVSVPASLEQKAGQALEELLGKGTFLLYLTVESEVVVRKSEDLQLGRSVVQSEQLKYEGMVRKGEPNDYTYGVTSRNYVIEQFKTTDLSTQNQISSIRCVVVVDEDSWGQVQTARAVLESLLGIESERGDELTFVKAE
jgi:hypothetical protein